MKNLMINNKILEQNLALLLSLTHTITTHVTLLTRRIIVG
jgi:hypothetical protein